LGVTRVSLQEDDLLALFSPMDRCNLNRRDLDEENDQVSIMADIYALATQFFIWLGDGNEGFDTFFEILKEVGTNQFWTERFIAVGPTAL